ncbi:hypothetical protein R1sor_002091 [Riccia sorocarpa]|uniref:FAR1-related sequence 11-like HTH-like domain-containing protein n=1 Tax=Riccia sorocarpa TaxID=122646 RepID=A0ABD3H1T0_9MARC
MVRMQIDEIAGIEKWRCVQHISEHNHHLLSAQEVRQLPAYRCISPEEKGRIRMCKEAGMTVNVMMNLMRIEANKSLSFTATDVRNYLASTGETTSHDTQELLKTLKDKHEQDPEFFYTFTVDCEGRLEHLLWIHSQTRRAALYFGDVIIFDTTTTEGGVRVIHEGFSCTWEVETVEEFESVWVILIDQYKLTENRHIKDLFQLREYWCPVWTRGYFTAGMTITQRSESINRFMDYFMGTQTKLHEFVDAFDKAMDKRADSMITATTREKLLLPKLSTTFPMEKKASERFSHYAFQKFQKELILSAEYVFQDGKVSHFQHPDIERSVTYDAEKKLVQCSCLMFESTGILCRLH